MKTVENVGKTVSRRWGKKWYTFQRGEVMEVPDDFPVKEPIVLKEASEPAPGVDLGKPVMEVLEDAEKLGLEGLKDLLDRERSGADRVTLIRRLERMIEIRED